MPCWNLKRHGLGLVAVCDEQHVVSVFTDGDYHRWHGRRRRAHHADSEAMTPNDLLRSRAQSRAIDAKETPDEAQNYRRRWSMKTANSPAINLQFLPGEVI